MLKKIISTEKSKVKNDVKQLLGRISSRDEQELKSLIAAHNKAQLTAVSEQAIVGLFEERMRDIEQREPAFIIFLARNFKKNKNIIEHFLGKKKAVFSELIQLDQMLREAREFRQSCEMKATSILEKICVKAIEILKRQKAKRKIQDLNTALQARKSLAENLKLSLEVLEDIREYSLARFVGGAMEAFLADSLGGQLAEKIDVWKEDSRFMIKNLHELYRLIRSDEASFLWSTHKTLMPLINVDTDELLRGAGVFKVERTVQDYNNKLYTIQQRTEALLLTSLVGI